MADQKKYYWLKLKRDFFKRHDTRIIETMENGEKYLLFYMKLLVESIDHEGRLRFSDTIPYNEKMLATITNTDVDIVRTAVKVFIELEMMSQMDDGTLHMAQVETMIGDETEWAEKKRIYRQEKKIQLQIEAETVEGQKRTLSDKSIELELEKDIREEEAQAPVQPREESKKFRRPTLEEVSGYCRERGNTVSPERFLDYYESNGWKVGRNSMKDWKSAVRTWEGNERKDKPAPKPEPVESGCDPEIYAMVRRRYEERDAK